MAKIVGFEDIPLDKLVISRAQVRTSNVGKGIDELAESIRVHGLLEPILVAPPDQSGNYEIIIGQRRFLAHQELGKETITAGILDEKVNEITAKILSVTENLVREDLNQKDLIDVCTYLFNTYGTIQAIVEETGLSQPKVSKYVKYPRLIPELKALVDGGLRVAVALRAQDAAAATGEVVPEEAVKLAKEMAPMSGAQQDVIQKYLEQHPSVSIDEALEHAKTGGRVTQIQVTLGASAHASLRSFATDEGATLRNAAALLIEEGLETRGYIHED